MAPLLACSIIVQSSASGVYALTDTIDNLVKTEHESLKIAVLSDPHYYPESYVEDRESDAYKNYMSTELYLLEENAGIFKEALNMVAKDKEKPDLLLIPGDITKNNEKLGYQELNKILTDFEDKTGIEVFITAGNHDVNTGGFKFEDDKKVELSDSELATVQEYYQLMKKFGYDEKEHNTEFYISSTNKEEDALSYVSEPVDGFVILSLNSNTYKYDESGNATGQDTPGFSKELLNWAVDKIKEAEAAGKTVVGMSHHGILPHSTASLLSSSAMIANYEDVATALADAGLRYVFTGHMHENDIAEYTTAKGNTIYDIETGATAGYGSPVRTVTIDKETDKTDKVKETVEVSSSSVKTAVVKGKTINNLQEYIYDSIYKDSKYLQLKLGGALGGISDALANISLEDLIYGKEFAVKYGLSEKLGEAIFKEFDGDSIKTAEGDIVSFDFIEGKGLKVVSKTKSINEVMPYASLDDFILSIVREFDSKVFNKTFIDQELDKILDGILGIEVYEADNAEKKVLQDVINLFLIDHFLGAEDLTGWAEDALNELRNGGIVRDLIDGLLDNILGLLDSATGTVIADFKKLDSSLGPAINLVFSGSLFKAPTLQQVLNKLGNKDLSDIVKEPIDEYLNDYITPSFEKQFGTLIADLVYGLAGDDSQDDEIDGKSRVIVYEGSVEQDPTVENGLLPHSIAVTFGEDETTQKAFSWYTGKNVQTNEIQYVKKSDAKKDENGNVDFSNGTTIDANSELVNRSFPTVDLGIIAITKDKEVARHQIVLNNLQPGTEYYYRVGNTENGIYSEVATFETAAVNEDSFSFLAMGDTQAMLEEEYEIWGNILDIARNRYKDAKFMTHVGDMVDNGKNELQWQWFLNKAQDDLMNTTMVTASGNHEDSAPYSQVNHFNIDDLPQQDTKTGAFYKVDYGNALVITLNTSNLEDNKLSQDQIDWLKLTAKQSDAKWKIINLHKSTYSNGSHYTDADVVAIREQLDTVVTEAGIDLVIGGHDHTYARSEFLVSGNVEVTNNIETEKDGTTYKTAVNPEGTMYVTIGSTGPKFYNPKETELPIAYQPEVKTHMYAGVTIEGDTLYYNAYTVDVESGTDKLLDSYAITKDSEAPTILGVENNGSYYVDRVISASDNIELDSLTVNGVEVESGYVLEASNEAKEYTVVATDISGNTSTVTFNMVGLPTVNDINADENSKNKIEQIKTEFNAIKNNLPSERVTELQNLIYALESRYSALVNIENIDGMIEGLPAPEEVTASDVNTIKVLAKAFRSLSQESKDIIGEERLAQLEATILALEAAIKTNTLIGVENKIEITHITENGYFEIDTVIETKSTRDKISLFSINAIQNNTAIQPNGQVKVSIDLGEKTFDENSTLELVAPDGLSSKVIDAKVEENKLVFITNDLGNFRVLTMEDEVVEKEDLVSLISKAEAINTNAYTEESVKALNDAINSAKAVIANEKSTQEQVDDAIYVLQTAMDNLKRKPIDVVVNKEELQELVNQLNSFDTSKYTKESVKVYKDALAKARAVLSDKNATQDEVKNALEALRVAVEGLITNKELSDLVDSFKKFDLSKYTEETVKAFNEALEKAKEVLANKSATQVEIDEALEALTKAYKGLVEKSTSGDNNQNTGSGSTNKPGSSNGNGTNNGNGSNNGGNSSNGTSSGNPDTSDNSNIFVYMMAAATSILGVVGITLKNKKNN